MSATTREEGVHSRHRVTYHPNGATTHSYDFTEGTAARRQARCRNSRCGFGTCEGRAYARAKAVRDAGGQYPHLMDTLRRNKGRAWTFAGPHGAIDPRNIDIHIGTRQQAAEAAGFYVDEIEDAHKYMGQFENL